MVKKTFFDDFIKNKLFLGGILNFGAIWSQESSIPGQARGGESSIPEQPGGGESSIPEQPGGRRPTLRGAWGAEPPMEGYPLIFYLYIYARLDRYPAPRSGGFVERLGSQRDPMYEILHKRGCHGSIWVILDTCHTRSE